MKLNILHIFEHKKNPAEIFTEVFFTLEEQNTCDFTLPSGDYTVVRPDPAMSRLVLMGNGKTENLPDAGELLDRISFEFPGYY